MPVYHGNDLRKVTGGKKRPHRKVKRKALMGRHPSEPTVGERDEVAPIRVRGGGLKLRLKRAATANVSIPSRGETIRARILRVVSNPSSRDYDRRGVLTKGAVIETDVGLARVVSRPGQDGVVNAVLIEETGR